jgi:hypothetical protein
MRLTVAIETSINPNVIPIMLRLSVEDEDSDSSVVIDSSMLESIVGDCVTLSVLHLGLY